MKYKFFVSFAIGNKFGNGIMDCKTKNITSQIIKEWTNLINQLSNANDCVIISFQRISK